MTIETGGCMSVLALPACPAGASLGECVDAVMADPILCKRIEVST